MVNIHFYGLIWVTGISRNLASMEFYRLGCKKKSNPNYVISDDDEDYVSNEEEEDRLGRPLDDFEREHKLREIIDMKIEKVVLNLGIARTSVHFIENYKSTFDL